ncbi:MAG: TIGR04211 family SH3 domain-containing protein [Desulfobacterales bacterium]|jgi:SH3 domain protein|nr:TIGR04211 family SH3 domain-containing protein [Desulfobacterales bacterium]
MSQMVVRKTILVVLLIVAFIVSSSINSVFADTRYVSDRLIISVRDGQNQNAAVLGYIETGAPLDILEEKEDLLRIRTEDGIEGWVRAQYIISEKPKVLIIENLKNEITALKKEIETSKNEQDSASNTLSKTKKMYQEEIEELKEEVNINQKFAAKAKSDFIQLNKKHTNLLRHSKNTEGLIGEVEKLKKLNAELNTEAKNLRKDRKNPLKSNKIQSFIAGAGVLLFGFILGGSARKKKRSRFI